MLLMAHLVTMDGKIPVYSGVFGCPVRYVWEIPELKMVLQSDKRHTVPQDP